MVQLYANNAKSSLASGISTLVTTITVATGEGTKFPSPTGSDYFLATIVSATLTEIVKCTSRTGDVLTVVRAQEGTTAKNWSGGTTIEMRITRDTLTNHETFISNLGLSGGSNLVGYDPGLGTSTVRNLQSKLRDSVSVKDFNAKGDGSTDDTTAIQTALTWAVNNNTKLYFPQGIYIITSGLVINGNPSGSTGKIVQLEGVGGYVDGNPGATILKWNGSTNIGNTLFKANGIAKLICSGISFFGAWKIGKVFWATQGGGTYAPFGWHFEDCIFEGALAGGYGFFIDTTTNMARFAFQNCNFQAGPGAEGFFTANQNALNHYFGNCSFGPNDFGIHLNGGSYVAVGCEFALNAVADVYLQIHAPITMIECWTEQSRQFIISDYRNQNSPLTLINCVSSSYPWTYWKINETGRPQPTNNFSQWISILWDGNRGALNLIGTVFVDPFNGAPIGAISPTVASTILVSATNGTDTSPPRFNFVGALSQNGTDSYTEQFFNYGNSQLAAPRIAPKKKVFNYGNLSGSFTANTYLDSTARWTMTGNNTVTLSTTQTSAGDRYAVDVTQDGTGGKTLTFINAKTAGTFTPTSTAGARSRIEFEFDGTSWIEISRCLNLA